MSCWSIDLQDMFFFGANGIGFNDGGRGGRAFRGGRASRGEAGGVGDGVDNVENVEICAYASEAILSVILFS